MNVVLKKITINGIEIKLVKGDITEEKVDVIVNAANSRLRHGGGVAGAIVRKGGYEIQVESNQYKEVPVGEVAVTTAGKLPCKKIIHAVGPMWGEGEEEKKLRSAIRNALRKASELKAESVSLPAISSGIFGYPKAENAAIIMDEIRSFAGKEHTTLKEIRICIIDDDTISYFTPEFGID
ncbi:MAG: macro domain-containing protein [Calditrichia bacterium]